MRVDKFLWSVRYYKTRNIATQACRKGQVKINDVVAKPSREVYPTDKIELRKDQINYKLIVNDVPKSRVGAKLVPDLILQTTSDEDLELLRSVQKQNQQRHQMGLMGRPTKKDRRNLNDFLGH